jgi:hypothetical protein
VGSKAGRARRAGWLLLHCCHTIIAILLHFCYNVGGDDDDNDDDDDNNYDDDDDGGDESDGEYHICQYLCTLTIFPVAECVSLTP